MDTNTTVINYPLPKFTDYDSDSATSLVDNKLPNTDSCISDIEEFLSDSDSSDNEDLIVKQAIKHSHKFIQDDNDSDIDIKVRTYVEETLTKTLVRKCWKCRRRFIKEEGCNEVTCLCGAVTCYYCRHAVTRERASLHVFCPVDTSTLDDSNAVAITGRRIYKKVNRVFPRVDVSKLIDRL
jgi:hypothetical protein